MNIEDKLNIEGKKLNDHLAKNIGKLNPKNKAQIIKVLEKYVSVFHPHFVVWVYAMQSSCSSSEGKHAAAHIANLELRDDHQMMLLDFMKQFNVEPNIQTYKQLLPRIKAISTVMHDGIKHRNGTGPATVIHLLEKSSEIFIPWIEKVAHEYRVKDLTYVHVHGAADKIYSDFANVAVAKEYQASKATPAHIEKANEVVSALLLDIFSE